MRENVRERTKRAAQSDWPVDAPLLAEADEEVLEEVEADEEGGEDEDEAEEDALDDVAEDVVAHLVAEDEGDLIRGAFGDGGVPDDDALGGAEAGDVGVEGGDLVGGFHEEHAVRGDIDAFAACDDLFKLGYEGGIGFGEGFEVVEERVDDVRGDEDGEEGDEHDREPEDDPPAAGKLADEVEEQHDQEAAEDVDEGERFELVGDPAAPVLDGEAVGELYVLGVEIERQGEKGGEDEEFEEEEEALGPAVLAEVVGDVAHAGGDAELQDEEELEDAPGLIDEVESGAGVGEGDGLGHLAWREGVGGLVLVGGLDRGGLGERGVGASGEGDDGEECEEEQDQSTETHGGIVREGGGKCKRGRGRGKPRDRIDFSTAEVLRVRRVPLSKRVRVGRVVGMAAVLLQAGVLGAAGPGDKAAGKAAGPALDSALIQAMDSELSRAMGALGASQPVSEAKGEAAPKPYFMSYAVSDAESVSISAQFGAITGSNESRRRMADVQIRLGSPAQDNTHGDHRASALTTVPLPLTDDREALARSLWFATNRGYGRALDSYLKVKTEQQVRAKEEDASADFSAEKLRMRLWLRMRGFLRRIR